MKVITNQSEEMRKSLISNLSKTNSVAITLDLWSDRTMRGFMGLTCHFEQEDRLVTRTLATHRVTG